MPNLWAAAVRGTEPSGRRGPFGAERGASRSQIEIVESAPPDRRLVRWLDGGSTMVGGTYYFPSNLSIAMALTPP